MPGTPTCSGSGSTAAWGSYLPGDDPCTPGCPRSGELPTRRGHLGLVLAVVVVGVVLLASAPVAARDQLRDRDALLAGEEAADVAHRGRLARHPDPGAVGDVRRAGGRRELGAEGVAGAPVVPGDRGLGRAGELDLVVGAVDLDVHVHGGRLRERFEQGA